MSSNFLTPDAIVESLDGAYSDTLTIVDFTRKVWSATTKDETAKVILAGATNAESAALKVGKYLFDGTTHHQNVVKALNDVYTQHKAMTTIYSGNGLRGLPNAAVGEYMARIDAMRPAFEDTLDEFKANYAADKAEGMKRLGSLGPSAAVLYPDVNELEDRFGFSYSFMPLPNAKGFSHLDPQTLTRLQINLERTVRERVEAVYAEALEDFRRSLLTIRDRLDARLKSFDVEPVPGARKSAPRLTESALNEPIIHARTLRRFARGDWAARMATIESVLERTLLTKNLSMKPDLVKGALKVINALCDKLSL